ncbi:MAG: DUF427 domain-containing protein [Ornithinimicrobium sp.]
MSEELISGVESVWDYPRPPDVVPTDEFVEIETDGSLIAQSSNALRVRETSHPPTYYLPQSDFRTGVLVPVGGTTFCEFKGVAHYFDIAVPVDSQRGLTSRAKRSGARRAAWHYPQPTAGFEQLRGYVAVMPSAVDTCRVNGEVVVPQVGDFYGGWITSRVRGPFKGPPGTLGW